MQSPSVGPRLATLLPNDAQLFPDLVKEGLPIITDNPEVIAWWLKTKSRTTTCGDSFDRDAQMYPFK